MKKATKPARVMLTVIAIVIVATIVSISAFAHSLQSWANYYTPNNAITNSAFQFTIDYSYHMSGNSINYFWADNTAKTYFETALTDAFSSSWGGMISGTETASSSAHLKIIYDIATQPPDAAAVANRYGGDANHHFRKGSQGNSKHDAEVTFFKDSASYSSTDKQRLAAHELGHLWGIGDLYNHLNGTNLESIYSQPYYYATATRHDINAMNIGLNNPWFQNVDNKIRYLKSPGIWAVYEWIQDIYFFNSNGNLVSSSQPCAQNCCSANQTCISAEVEMCQVDCAQQAIEMCGNSGNFSGCYNWFVGCEAGCASQASFNCDPGYKECMNVCSD